MAADLYARLRDSVDLFTPTLLAISASDNSGWLIARSIASASHLSLGELWVVGDYSGSHGGFCVRVRLSTVPPPSSSSS